MLPARVNEHDLRKRMARGFQGQFHRRRYGRGRRRHVRQHPTPQTARCLQADALAVHHEMQNAKCKVQSLSKITLHFALCILHLSFDCACGEAAYKLFLHEEEEQDDGNRAY